MMVVVWSSEIVRRRWSASHCLLMRGGVGSAAGRRKAQCFDLKEEEEDELVVEMMKKSTMFCWMKKMNNEGRLLNLSSRSVFFFFV
ncbi:uncharacterized protein DS421_5g145210 [Arachis hypogaea]|nr:uncharacterized protein DS421_5g145210 [Arachis hypogaea]